MKQSPALRATSPARHAGFARHAIAASIAAAFGTVVAPAWAQLPTGGQVVSGAGSISSAQGQMAVTTSTPTAVLNWQSFSIGGENAVRFDQPSASSRVLNRVIGNDPSNIFGSLSSNGAVWLINPHGVLFGIGSRVDVAGLVASTLSVSDADFEARRFRFVGNDAQRGTVINRGEITTTSGGHVLLVGDMVSNEGSITSRSGRIVLAAGTSVDLVDTGLPNLTVRVTAPANEVANLGSLLALNGGTIDLLGGIVNQQNIVRADTVDDSAPGKVTIRAQGNAVLSSASQTSANVLQNGIGGEVLVESAVGSTLVEGNVSATNCCRFGGDITLRGKNVAVYGGAQVDASGGTFGGAVRLEKNPKLGPTETASIYVGPNATIKANATANGWGGDIYIGPNSDATRIYGTLEAKGGPSGGPGGYIETSGQYVDIRAKNIDISSPLNVAGDWDVKAGHITIAADDGIAIPDVVNFDAPAAPNGGVVWSRLISDALVLDSAIVTVQAGFEREDEAVPVSEPGNILVESDILADGAGPRGRLNLEAWNDVILNPGVIIRSNAGPMPVSLIADADANGAGGITLGRGSRILTAGENIRLGGGSDDEGPSTPASRIIMDGSELDAGTGRITANATIMNLTDATLRSSATGDAIALSTRDFSNSNSVLAASAGRWLVYLSSGAGFPATAFNTLDYRFVQANADAETTPILSGVGDNGILMADPLRVNARVNAQRVYDGTRDANFSEVLSSNAPDGFVFRTDSDGAFTVEGVFADKNVGADKPISYGEASLPFNFLTSKGVPVYNADLSYTGDITPRQLGYSSLIAVNKIYDTTRTATVAGSPSNRIPGDAVFLGGLTGEFDTKNVGMEKAVTVTSGPLVGSDAPNYAPPAPTTTTADITPRAIILSGLVAADKVYDGTTTATLNGSLSGPLPGDDIALGGLSGQFDTKNVGTDKPVTVTSSLAGADATNYTLIPSPVLTADITPRPLALAGLAADNKVYDATTSATVSGSLSNRVEGDDVALGGLVGQFDTKNVGIGKTVTVTARPLAGVDAPNYSLPALPATTTADITPRPLALANLLADSRVYDATTTARVTASLSNQIAGDDVALGPLSGVFDTKNVGTGKTVAVSLAPLAGVDAANYTLLAPTTTTADITPRPISTAGIAAADKVYDGTRDASLTGGFLEVLPGDTLALGATPSQFEDKNAGTEKLVTFTHSALAGADAANYVLTGPLATRASITPRPVEIGITGQVQKEYDATTTVSLGAGQFVLNNTIANDSVAVSGPVQGQYDSPTVGQQKRVTATGAFDLSGADAPNYRVVSATPTGSGNTVLASASGDVGTITPATLVYTAEPAVRQAGLPFADFSGTVTGFRGTDDVTSATTGNLLWQSPATNESLPGTYAINGGGLSALNYLFVQAPGNAEALVLTNPPTSRPPPLAAASGTVAINTAIASAIPPIQTLGVVGGVFDISSPAASRTFGSVRIGSMNQEELAQMLAQRRDFKKKLFADAIYKLELDPRLADLQPCVTVADASTGACRVTAAQLEAMHATKPQLAKVAKSTASKAALPQIERKIAVLFGVNDYADKTIPPLVNAIPDVDAVSRLFAEKLGYEVRVLRNPSKADIVRTLNALSTEIDSSDSVVIYYAGHGYSLEKNGAGYWLPSDAAANDPRQWVSNSDVAKLLSSIRSRQMALISDSCYSGAFARDGMDAVGRNVTADDVLTKRSVVVLSSGGDEPVADEGKGNHSIFAWNLMQTVGSVANWKPGSTVFTDVQAAVRKEFPQTPKYGSVTAAGHQSGGDYLFELR